MSELKNAINSLGFPKAAAKHIFTEQEEEEQLARAMTVVTGVAALLETHFVSFYEPTALRNELRFLAQNFVKVQRANKQENESGDAIEAISEALQELGDVITKRNSKTIAEGSARFNIAVEERTVMLMKPAIFARTMAISLASSLDTDELKKLRDSNEPPEEMLGIIRTTLDKAYLCPADEATKSVFAMHAKTQARKAITFVLQRRASKD